MFIRANDPHHDDVEYQVKTLLGRLCNRDLSTKTLEEIMDQLTSCLKGVAFSADVFRKMGLETVDEMNEQTSEREIRIHVPEFFVASTVEDRSNQWITFKISEPVSLNFSEPAVVAIDDSEKPSTEAD